MLRGEFEPTPSPRRSSVCSAALACGARVLCACACWIRVCVCVCCVRAAGVCCVLYSAARPVCAALRRWLGWQGCAVGCGVLRVVARLPDGVRRTRSPPDRVVGGPGRERAVCAALRLLRGWRVCFRAERDARMCSRCGRGRARGAAWSHRGPTSVGLRRVEGGARDALPPSRCARCSIKYQHVPVRAVSSLSAVRESCLVFNSISSGSQRTPREQALYQESCGQLPSFLCSVARARCGSVSQSVCGRH